MQNVKQPEMNFKEYEVKHLSRYNCIIEDLYYINANAICMNYSITHNSHSAETFQILSIDLVTERMARLCHNKWLLKLSLSSLSFLFVFH